MTSILSYIIFGVIIIGSFVAIGLTIYRRILEIKKMKNEKKSLEKESVK